MHKPLFPLLDRTPFLLTSSSQNFPEPRPHRLIPVRSDPPLWMGKKRGLCTDDSDGQNIRGRGAQEAYRLTAVPEDKLPRAILVYTVQLTRFCSVVRWLGKPNARPDCSMTTCGGIKAMAILLFDHFTPVNPRIDTHHVFPRTHG